MSLHIVAFLLCAVAILPLRGQTFTSLASFDRTNGANPEYSPLVQGTDGNFYGTTTSGGSQDGGTVFKITPGGTLTTLYNFGGSNNPGGTDPYAGLVLGADGNFYGTTLSPSTTGVGTIYKITPAGVLTTLFTFAVANDGTLPYNSLVQASDGNLYGTAYEGGANSDGTVFKMTPGGSFTNLHSFDFTDDGEHPRGALIQGSDGKLYGTTSGGGAHGNGTVFSITTAGEFTTLYSFTGIADGGQPYGALTQASDGNFYGTTRVGTIFKITSAGVLTTLHTFRLTDGRNPTGGVVQASDGNFYGTTEAGGANNDGTIFRMTADGTLTTLHSFSGADGQTPQAGLVQGADGILYGTTTSGGNNVGTVFSLALSSTTSPAPVISASGIVNGASFVGGGVVPGELATVFGSNLTSANGINLTSGLPLPTGFLKSSVIVNGQPVPLFAVDNVNGQQQINFQVPWEVASGANATLAVENNGVTSANISVPVLAAQPGIFNYGSGGKTFGAILHANFQLADTGHPAKPAETVLIYCTGLGAVMSPPADGAAGNGQSTATAATVTMGGANAMVSFSGLAPGFVGLYQVNAEVPAGLSAGNQAVVVTLAGASSNSVLLPVQ
jgi:uncharacterized protein (TIGR03437 family)